MQLQIMHFGMNLQEGLHIWNIKWAQRSITVKRNKVEIKKLQKKIAKLKKKARHRQKRDLESW